MPGVGEAADQLQLDAALGVAQGELLDALHHGADGLVGAGAVEVGEGHGARTWTKKFGVIDLLVTIIVRTQELFDFIITKCEAVGVLNEVQNAKTR